MLTPPFASSTSSEASVVKRGTSPCWVTNVTDTTSEPSPWQTDVPVANETETTSRVASASNASWRSALNRGQNGW